MLFVRTKTMADYTSAFDIARKAWPGVKRGLETEFKCLKKHKDWKKIIHLLKAAIDEQISRRKQKISLGLFVPPWKNFKTWLNNRCWEEEEQVAGKKSSHEELNKEVEKRKKRDRELCEDWLRDKSSQALIDLKKDKSALVPGWLINEILNERNRQMNKLKGE